MTKIIKIITLFILTFGIFINIGVVNTNALGTDPIDVNYCKNWDCGLDKWVELVKTSIKDIDTTWKATDKVQNIVKYLLWFLTLVAVIYIIYAWFRILTSSGEDEVIKSQKKTIIYVIIWILVIWFAWTIANFAVEIWASAWK